MSESDVLAEVPAHLKRASRERKRLFSVLSTENIIQILILVSGLACAYAYMSADLRTVIRDTAAMNARLDERDKVNSNKFDEFQKAIADVTRTSQNNSTVNAQQAAEISSLQIGRDTDRKLLMEINASIAVLLDRTDPRKGTKTP